METHEQRKVALSESPSVRLCSKCGWPYPKPHPSSKHRRAHKKICGTIEGYKLIDSANLGASGSDEDPKTPSPKLEKRRSDEISGGGGVGGRSNRSEDEVFSDAVTEFSDSWSSPVHEDTVKVAAVLSDKKVGSLVECDLKTNQEPQVVVSTGHLQLPNHPTNNSQTQEKVPKVESKPRESAITTEDIVSNGNSDLVSSEDLPLRTNDVEGSARSPISANSPKENGKENVVEQGTLSSAILNDETSVDNKEENSRDEVPYDVAVTTPSETSNEALILPSVGAEKFSETSSNVNHIGNSADSTQDTNVLSHRGSNDDVHVLSVVDDIPMVDHAETMIKGFKDPKSVEKNLPVTLDVSEEIGPMADANKSITSEGDVFSFLPRKSDEGITISSTGSPFLEGDLKEKDGGDVVSVTEGPIEVADDASNLNISCQPESCKKDHQSEEGDAVGQESFEVVGNISTTMTESVNELSVPKADKLTIDGLEFSGATEISEPAAILDNGTNSLKKDLQESTTPFYRDTSEGGLDASSVGNTSVSNYNQQNMLHEDSEEGMKECRVNSTNEVTAESAATVSEFPGSDHGVGVEMPGQSVEASIDPILLEADSDTRQSFVENGHCTESKVGASGIGSKQVQEEGDENQTIEPIKGPVIDASVDSSSLSDSLEANWGSISGAAFSTQSDAQGATDTETPRPTTTEAVVQPEKIDLQKPETNPKEHQSSAETDTFEAPSFMTLVEPENRLVDQEAPSEDAQAKQRTNQAESKEFQAAWFPTITNVANDSHGRKKNEEIIAKVTNWSVGGANQPQHTPLKSLLVEANPETKLRSPRKEEKAPVLTVNSILGHEAAMDEDSKREMGKEWDSPARYPSEIKKEKKKKNKGRPLWLPFVCCSSVN